MRAISRGQNDTATRSGNPCLALNTEFDMAGQRVTRAETLLERPLTPGPLFSAHHFTEL